MEEKESCCGFLCNVDAMKSEMHRRLHEMMMAKAEKAGYPMMPAIRGAGMAVDVREIEDEVVVVADLPGVESSDVKVRLTSPGTLWITARRKEEAEEGYAVKERISGEMTRTVNLPADVLDEGATATFKNGVLTVRLKKVPTEEGIMIPIREEGE
jgi:HSP20 family protein